MENNTNTNTVSSYFQGIWKEEDVLPSIRHPNSLVLPGITEQSRKTVAKLTLRDLTSHSLFFNSQGFHNHLMHHVFAAFSLGASSDKLEEIYELNAKIQMPPNDFSTLITAENYTKFIGMREHSSDYLRFFTQEILSKGIQPVISHYLFDSPQSADFFASFMSGVFHPMIHLGYGLEFNSPPIIAQALAMAACTKPNVKPILLDPILSSPIDTAKYAFSSITSSLGFSKEQSSHGLSALSIVDKIYSDTLFKDAITFKDNPKIMVLLSNQQYIDKIKEYVNKWVFDNTKEDIQYKINELIGFCMGIYAGTTRPGQTTRPRQDIKLDFFIMHCLTSSLFLPIFSTHLTPPQMIRLLQSHFSVTIAYYISRGSPRLHLSDNVSTYTSEEYDSTSNPWLKVIQNTLEHEDVHLVKVIRTLVYGATYLGNNDRGRERRNTPGEVELTSHYWLNSAKITLDGIKGDNTWEMDGIGFDEVWDGRSDKGANAIESDEQTY